MADKALGWHGLADRIKEIREWAGKTQAEMAAFVGVSQSHVSDVERHESKPSIEFVLGIGEKFPTISRTWLITGEGGFRTESMADASMPSALSAFGVVDCETAEHILIALRAYEAMSETAITRKARHKLWRELGRLYMASGFNTSDWKSVAKRAVIRRAVELATFVEAKE